MNTNYQKPVWLLGVGESLLRYKEQTKKLEAHITIGFHKFFPYCLEYFDFAPTYWTWYDPHAAMPGLDYLLKEKSLPANMEVLLPYSHLMPRDRASEHLNLSARKKLYDDYYSKIITLKKRGLKIHCLNTLNNAFVRKKLNKSLSSISYEERFFKNHMILGTSEEANSGHIGGAFESKLSYYMLPLVQYMEIDEAFVMGFDGKGGRFYNLGDKVCAGHNLKYLSEWREWFTDLDINMFCVCDSECTHLNKYLEYMDIETAINLSRPDTEKSKSVQLENLGRVLERKFSTNIYNC